MRVTLNFLFLLLMTLCFSNCTANEKSNPMDGKTIMEVTTFNLNPVTNPSTFAKRDAQVESDFTSKQVGFVKRQSGVDENGNYVVVVYWNSLTDADASMKKFMSDTSVADYAKMINASTMKMSRYAMDQTFISENSRFVEIMSFDLKKGTDMDAFNATNKKVETDFTGKQEGFLQRLTGVNEAGTQVVAVYWESKELSDASLEPFMQAPIAQQFMQSMNQATITMGRYKFLNMDLSNKEKVVALLNTFNTGEHAPIAYINPSKYIQHNLDVADGLEGFGAVMQHAPPQGSKANVIRAFQDGDYVFTHTEYDFFGPKVGFDVFRFEEGLIVEHWDNLLEIQAANPSGHSQFDGATDITDKAKTEANKKHVRDLLEKVFMQGEMDKVANFISPTNYIQHNPMVPDGLEGLGSAMKMMAEQGMTMQYDTIHKVLGEGNFVLTMSEGKLGGEPTAYYDLFRLEDGLIVEHWDVITAIPAKSEWKNDNGKF